MEQKPPNWLDTCALPSGMQLIHDCPVAAWHTPQRQEGHQAG
jgi:hypothetical protein